MRPPQVAATNNRLRVRSPAAHARLFHGPFSLAGDPTFADFPRTASDRDTMLTIG